MTFSYTGTFGGGEPVAPVAPPVVAYATLDEFKTWLEFPADDDGSSDDHLNAILLAASRWIDQQCGRHFSLEIGAIKLYYPSSGTTVEVVDLVTVVSVKLDTTGDRTYGTTLDATEYELLPYLDTNSRPSVRYQQVRIWPKSSHAFTSGELVRIVGDFGYLVDGQTPSEIHLACLMLASRWWKRHETPTGSAIIPDTGTFDRIAGEDPDIKALLLTYDRSSASSWVLV